MTSVLGTKLFARDVLAAAQRRAALSVAILVSGSLLDPGVLHIGINIA